MKISIITTCYNREETILDALNSVKNQDYDNIEHIIIDGNSSDNSLGIIEENMNKRMKVFSEEDNGAYDAFNKGIEKSSGDIIGFLHSDDVFYSNKVASDICKNIGDAPGIYGNLIYVDRNDIDKKIRTWKSKSLVGIIFILDGCLRIPLYF